MIGDHHNDMAAARGAAVPAIFVAWGYGPPAMAEGARGADMLVIEGGLANIDTTTLSLAFVEHVRLNPAAAM
jgi:hypothetical protein